MEMRDCGSLTSIKKSTRCRSFHFRYLELCRSKNVTPLSDIRSKNNATSLLDFSADKIGVTDWGLIVESLYYDQVLQTLAIRLRRCQPIVLEHLDTEKKAKFFRQKPCVCTKYVFTGVIEAVSKVIELNKNLRILCLEGLPINDMYVETIAKALSANDNLKEISFQRSNLGDKGCEAICNALKYMDNVEKLNLSHCGIGVKGAECVSEMIKVQKISRYTEGWQQSLRYRPVDPETISGLRFVNISHNPEIGDDGLQFIIEVLKEDVWIKYIEMEDCGITDRGANSILDCLELNNYLLDFNVRGNPNISKFLHRSIQEQLGKYDEDQKLTEQSKNAVQNKKNKLTPQQMQQMLKSLDEQLKHEQLLRKKAEMLNEKLTQRIHAYEQELASLVEDNKKAGYVLVKNDSLQSIINERNNLKGPNNNEKKHEKSVIHIDTPASCKTQLFYEDTSETEKFNYDKPPDTPHLISAILHREGRKLNVRKIKSEVKYVDVPMKDSYSKKKESKSDHEFGNDKDLQFHTIHFETNIGDSAANNPPTSLMPNTSMFDKKHVYENKNNVNYNRSINIHNPNHINHKFELDDLSISSARTHTSDTGSSSDSDTLRNSNDAYNKQPMQVFVRNNAVGPHGLLVNTPAVKKSPRSLFLGLCD
ncbi:protein Cep78 homolog isoform X2 [Teleopsis dalmanni]|nr:protein Cep78 homolog isoform X2 [Teleopsis dalmanni]